ncbi:MAG: hypothetical protein WAM79_09960 [Candidatus Sulfotelmatobacter sp.]
MTRINPIRNTRSSLSWGKNIAGDINVFVFAAILIVCSVAVGCSSDKPKPVTSNTPSPVTQAPAPAPMPAPVMLAETKPAPKRSVVHRRPPTVNYADKTYGVTFEYPRRFAIETGDAASRLVSSNPLPMNFVQPGGVALAAVELPETYYVNTDFSSAFFNVSVNKSLTADQCSEFAVPQPKSVEKPAEDKSADKSDISTPTSTDVAKQDSPKSDSQPAAQPATTDQATTAKSDDVNPNSKLLIGDMELRATEAVSGEGTRQNDSKFFHVYQNGACYEFALNVTTDASEEGLVKHVDRDRVFNRLEAILSTVKINPVQPDVTAEAPTPAAPQTPAQ